MRRKRRNRGTWMPVNGHNEVGDGATAEYADFRVSIQNVPTDGGFGPGRLFPIPLVPDFTEEQDVAGLDQLRDIVQGQSWLLQRIVGKIHLKCVSRGVPVSPGQIWPNVFVTAGFLVCRAQDNDQSIDDLTAQESDPTHRNNAMNPWIWRRSWMLGHDNELFGRDWAQNTTAAYGSVADGPHIDSKVKRLITREHRLWFTMAARGYDPFTLTVNEEQELQPGVDGIVDLRIFGSLRTQRNKSAF